MNAITLCFCRLIIFSTCKGETQNSQTWHCLTDELRHSSTYGSPWFLGMSWPSSLMRSLMLYRRRRSTKNSVFLLISSLYFLTQIVVIFFLPLLHILPFAFLVSELLFKPVDEWGTGGGRKGRAQLLLIALLQLNSAPILKEWILLGLFYLPTPTRTVL